MARTRTPACSHKDRSHGQPRTDRLGQVFRRDPRRDALWLQERGWHHHHDLGDTCYAPTGRRVGKG
eukprot:1876822-Rhodomonas_salina.1